MIPRSFFDTKPQIDGYLDHVGYCINCGVRRNDTYSLGDVLKDLSHWLCMALHGYIRIIDVECDCGSTKALFDMDVENYRAWDITEVKNE